MDLTLPEPDAPRIGFDQNFGPHVYTGPVTDIEKSKTDPTRYEAYLQAIVVASLFGVYLRPIKIVELYIKKHYL